MAWLWPWSLDDVNTMESGSVGFVGVFLQAAWTTPSRTVAPAAK
jgi:hypothetical protein